MKNITLFLACILMLSGCREAAVQKPGNLLSEDKMVDILYDLSLLEGIKASNPDGTLSKGIDPLYVYKKYKIDSLQFASSDHYYASDLKQYARIYQRVTNRIEKHKKEADSLARILPAPNAAGQPEKGAAKNKEFPLPGK